MKRILIILILIGLIRTYFFIDQQEASNEIYNPERPILLTFGKYVTPGSDDNPISPPERFIGFHSGVDIETLPGEEDKKIEVRALCDGVVLAAATAEGYGGYLTHTCDLNNQKVTVLYGHIDPNTFKLRKGEYIKKDEILAYLSKANSMESGFTRKHLHVGVYKEERPLFPGYIQNERELEQFLDPRILLQ